MTGTQTYRLELQMTIVALDDRGNPEYNNGLRVNDTLSVNATSFMEIAGVLSRFHELAERLKEAQAVAAETRDRFDV